ncbi:hypothetical protein Pgin02_01771 [Porphyromonas gingivalis]
MNKREIQFILLKRPLHNNPPLISIKTDTSIDLTKKGELHAISLQTSSNLKNT